MHISIEPDRARPGDEVVITLQGLDAKDWLGGLYADFEENTPEGWTTIFHLTGTTGNREYAPPIEPGRPRFQFSVGIRGPLPFQIPQVPPGIYRFRREYVQPGPVIEVLYGNIVVEA